IVGRAAYPRHGFGFAIALGQYSGCNDSSTLDRRKWTPNLGYAGEVQAGFSSRKVAADGSHTLVWTDDEVDCEAWLAQIAHADSQRIFTMYRRRRNAKAGRKIYPAL